MDVVLNFLVGASKARKRECRITYISVSFDDEWTPHRMFTWWTRKRTCCIKSHLHVHKRRQVAVLNVLVVEGSQGCSATDICCPGSIHLHPRNLFKRKGQPTPLCTTELMVTHAAFMTDKEKLCSTRKEGLCEFFCGGSLTACHVSVNQRRDAPCATLFVKIAWPRSRAYESKKERTFCSFS